MVDNIMVLGRGGAPIGFAEGIRKARVMIALLAGVIFPSEAMASAAIGPATEWTQLLNNVELVGIAGQSAEQVQNQLTQIGQLATQIQNQIQIYENMLQNTLQLPDHVWGQVEADLTQLQTIVNQGQGIAFSMGSLDDVLKQRFQSFAEFETGLDNGETFSASYQEWSDTNRETIAATLRAAGLTSDQFETEEATMGQLRSMSETAVGQMQALQVAHQIAAQQVEQTQKLRGLVSQQTTMFATWFQSEQAAKDLAQTRRDDFFEAPSPSVGGGQTMEPRW
jgi:P-type conjugative transfer protein TrbJ